MKRLQRKCLFVSAGLHCLLALIVLLASAFQSGQPARPALTTPGAPAPPLLQIEQLPQIPDSISTGTLADAGPRKSASDRNPNPTTPSDPTVTDGLAPTKARKPQISTNLVFRGSQQSPGHSVSSPGPSTDQILDRISHSAVSGAPVALDIGSAPGQGDAIYLKIVKEIYSAHWEPVTAGPASDMAAATVSVTIANNGKVTGAKIIKPSGNLLLDQSVERVLERVTFVAPFNPQEAQRTYTINFRLRAD